MIKEKFENIFIKSKNEELSQAFVRIVLVHLLVVYFITNELYFEQENISTSAILSIIFISPYSIFHYVWIKKSPSRNHIRQVIGIFIDVTSISAALIFLEWAGLMLFSIYLWIIVANGMRFGSYYLYVAMTFTLIEFSIILYYHPFWIENREIGLGLVGVIIFLPLFFLMTINRLRILNTQLQQQLEIQKQQETILIQQSRHAAMGEMISNIAHQWRQPLNAIGLLLQNIELAYEMDILDEAYIQKSVAKGVRLTGSMSKTIDDFRDFFKPNKQKQFFNIENEIKNSLAIIDATLIHNNIEVIYDFKEKNEFYGYSNEFSQVLLNILANAKDILIEKKIAEPKIWISSYCNTDSIIIKIKDNGEGVPSDIIDKIFDPYYTTKEEGQGTGIGLYMSKLIIEDHLNGMLKVNNDDKGAVFSIILAKDKKNV